MTETTKTPAVKKRKVFQVATELKLTTASLVEYMDSKGYDVKKKQLSLVTEEIYADILNKFDKARYQEFEAGAKKDSRQLRERELEEILATKPMEEKTDSEHKKIELPKFRATVIEEAKPAKKSKLEEVSPEVEEETAANKKKSSAKTEAKKSSKGIAKEDQQVTAEVELEKVSVETDAGEMVVGEPEAEIVLEAEPVKKRKIELPKAQTLKVIEKAPEKPKAVPPKVEAESKEESDDKPKKKKLRRKRSAIEYDKIGDEAVETPATAQEKAKKRTTSGEATAMPAAAKSGKKRRRRRSSKADTIEELTGTAAPEVKSKRRKKVDQKEVDAKIRETLAKISGPSKIRRSGKQKTDEVVEEGTPTIQITEFLTTQELANNMDVPVAEVIKVCIGLGMMVTINQRLDNDVVELIASELGFDVEFVSDTNEDDQLELAVEEDLLPRQPVVTIMGHVDHGKTTLLDYLRRTRVAEGEAGGITQHIGAYQVEYEESLITFLDTPGHEAFTAMRARGAQVTDIVVLVVAADDRVMPQTLEAIDHARAAEVPIVIAVNKVDKPGANPETIYQQLADHNILVEKWGGKYQSAEISAKFGQNIEGLLAEILVAADILELKADPSIRARGTVVESRLDKGLGVVATILIETGTLKIGDPFVIGQQYGKVRALYGDIGDKRTEAGPATPIQVVGFNGVPQAGDRMHVLESEKAAREISLNRQRNYREMSMRQIKSLTLDQVSERIKESELGLLPLIIKGDVHGSIEVLSDSLMKLSNNEVQVQIIRRGVGAIVEADVMLAAASNAIIIGFHVHPNIHARDLAREEGVEIRLYRIIHEVVDEVRSSLEGLLTPDKEERVQGTAQIRKVYRISRIGSVAGCHVMDGKIQRQSRVRLIRDGVEIWHGELSSLKRFQDDTKEVVQGFECGMSLQGYNDIHENDEIQAYEIVELARKLEETA
ncbi:translation initiation factor IF-2 [Calditrichota bacterium]